MPKPKNLDAILAEFAGAFAGSVRGTGDLPKADTLNREVLDGSLNSLAEVDRYLRKLRGTRRLKLQDQEMSNLIHWCGAYAGECIRRSAKPSLHWLTRSDYLALYPALKAAIPEDIGTKAILAAEDGAFTLPLSKVIRFVEGGDEHSLEFYAKAQVNEFDHPAAPPKRTPRGGRTPKDKK